MTINSSFLKASIPYAEALFGASQSAHLADSTGDDLKLILEFIEKPSDLKEFLANPLIAIKAKKNVLNKLFSDQISDQVLNFLYILADRRRIFLLSSITQYYFFLINKLHLVALAQVNTAFRLSQAQKQLLKDKLKDVTGSKQIELIEKIDPELIGGFVIKIGSKVIDMSLDGQLAQISFYLNGSSL